MRVVLRGAEHRLEEALDRPEDQRRVVAAEGMAGVVAVTWGSVHLGVSRRLT
jgi:hypothetical protein